MLATRCSMLATASGFAAEDDFHGLGIIAGREHGLHLLNQLGWQIDVVGLAGLFVVKMRVWVEIRAVPGRATLKVDRAHEIARHERFETVIDRGERDGRALGFDAGENLVGGWVIALFQEHIIDDLALRRRAQAAGGELLREGVGG